MSANESPLLSKVDQLRAELQTRNPQQLAFQTATSFREGNGAGAFHFPYWGKEVVLSSRDFLPRSAESGEPLAVIHQAIIAYYFHTSKGSPPARGWISFSELPDGQFYTAAFQSYTGKKILQSFGADYARFESRCREICGKSVNFGDGAYQFQVLPRAAVLTVYWRGDEDFPPSYKVLFEDTINYHLPTDGCAILGSMLTGKLIS